jgi:ribosomal-protein-alanine N-acetyltransferase
VTGPALVLERPVQDDAWALARLEERSFSHPWTAAEFLRALKGTASLVVLRDPRAARAPDRGIRAYCAFQAVADEAEIHNLAVHTEHRRRGLGRLTLGLVLELLARRGVREVHLEVRAGNAAALGLYRVSGFEVAGARRDYYSRPREDAVLLRRSGLRDP